eukprot:m.203823 g.203823  ORF g.203823 m.203823 type:complete len:50 (-) comp10694_c0_seq5:41-190(-)
MDSAVTFRRGAKKINTQMKWQNMKVCFWRAQPLLLQRSSLTQSCGTSER